MTIILLERNLMWSARLAKSAAALGHSVRVAGKPDGEPADVAIVNLGEQDADAVAALKAAGVYVIGHAGHKERPLIAFGEESGCDRVVTNSELTHKFDRILEEAAVAR
jgi:hypothetical protein